jgi:hypothetical protein
MRTAKIVALAVTLFTPLSACAQDDGAPRIGIHLAALQGNVQAINQHIEAGSDLNEKDAYGSTPLIVAATFGKTEVARALIEAGADLNITNNDGSTALHVAAFLCRTEIVEALLAHGALDDLQNRFGDTPLESVTAPFEDVRGAYDSLGRALRPLGLQLDYEHLKTTRPKIAEMLSAQPQG